MLDCRLAATLVVVAEVVLVGGGLPMLEAGRSVPEMADEVRDIEGGGGAPYWP